MSTIGLDSILANQGSVETTTAAQTSSALGKDSFLQLLVAQLQYQDPLDPVENTDFTAQLAQFSSLEALTEINDSMDQVNSLQGSLNNMQALSFIGKEVNAQGDIIHYTGEDIPIDFTLDDNAAEVVVSIYSEDGTLVKSVDLGDAAKGNREYVWDGTDSSGETVSAGRYTFTVEAVDYEGLAVGSTSYASGEVTGVRYDNGTTYLIIGDKEVAISDVEKISG